MVLKGLRVDKGMHSETLLHCTFTTFQRLWLNDALTRFLHFKTDQQDFFTFSRTFLWFQ
ncbi:hypothetical protein E2C01_077779 [Portunus trituberculatus]|uniref:Uncharacterized protein n=1 Tax=Portunus trituberculatus TaxID=210409 RepID=A0A5B7IQM6_PORTR|nr:hypothetical protein [Portunus trituberculatus]